MLTIVKTQIREKDSFVEDYSSNIMDAWERMDTGVASANLKLNNR